MRSGEPGEPGSREDDDEDLHHFQRVLRFAQRIRLVGGERIKHGRAGGTALNIKNITRFLSAGPECALMVLEVQPIAWSKEMLSHTLRTALKPLITRPDVGGRLKIRLIRDESQGLDLDDMEDYLRRFHSRLTGRG